MTPLIEASPSQPVDGVLVLDRASLRYATRSKHLKRMASEKLATNIVLYVFDWQYVRSRGPFGAKACLTGALS
jgi:hypothetical protein